ncbi:MAG TPA: hypothetical protein VLC98_12800 [Phnomibacter sp.]|nr:hypothetical protein [Phnomibacter sp.]
MRKQLPLTLLFLLTLIHAQAQQPDTAVAPSKAYKNIVRYNLSGPILFGFNYLVFGYERILKPNQSMSMNIGQASLSNVKSFSTDSVSMSKSGKNSGFNFSLDYRFYLSKENKYPAPHGVYVGPYYSYNRFNRNTDWKLKNSSAGNEFSVDSRIDIHTIGAEMGYQFVLWKDRMVLDFVLIGPGISNYKISAELDGNINASQKDQILDAVQQLLTQKFPGMDYAIGDEKFDASGNISSWNTGFRYLIHIGFRF